MLHFSQIFCVTAPFFDRFLYVTETTLRQLSSKIQQPRNQNPGICNLQCLIQHGQPLFNLYLTQAINTEFGSGISN